jgi:hypothetical protein
MRRNMEGTVVVLQIIRRLRDTVVHLLRAGDIVVWVDPSVILECHGCWPLLQYRQSVRCCHLNCDDRIGLDQSVERATFRVCTCTPKHEYRE